MIFFFNLAQSLTLLLHFFVVVLLVMVIYYFALSIFFSNTDLVILCNNYSSMLWLMTKYIITQCILRGSKTEPSGISLKTSSQTKSAPLINTFEYWVNKLFIHKTGWSSHLYFFSFYSSFMRYFLNYIIGIKTHSHTHLIRTVFSGWKQNLPWLFLHFSYWVIYLSFWLTFIDCPH